ncbi:MAG: hypothetical protein QF860_12750 [Planctomycetota bacterium]|nr:hypothetical protein [Planctomycetota bacterium]
MLGALGSLEWTRPAGLLALALPVLLLLLHRARSRPPSVATGTLGLWRDLEGTARRADRRLRRAVPPRLWLLCASLTLGAAALGGPRLPAPPAARTWSVVVDRSPSMYLSSDGSTRLALALDRARALLEMGRAGGDALEWESFFGGEHHVHAGDAPPAAWLTEPRAPAAEPAWETLDAPGRLWVTDALPEPAPRFAGWAASGGEAVPGPVGRTREGVVVFDGEGLTTRPAQTAPPILVLTGPLPGEVTELARLWAAERGLDVADGPTPGALLDLRGVSEGPVSTVPVGRDGWSARAVARAAPLADGRGPLVPWLADEARRVAFGPGRVVCAIEGLDELTGDPAAFAVSWAELLDAACGPPAGCVPTAERRAAGTGGAAEPAAPEPAPIEGRPPLPVDAWLAVGALLAALVALWPPLP